MNRRFFLLLFLLALSGTGCMPRLCRYAPGEPGLPRGPVSSPVNRSLPSLPAPASEQLFRLIHRRNPQLREDLGRHIADGILQESEQFSIDARLVAAVISVESSFNTKAVSCTGAKGLGQFISSTARDLGITDPFDVDQGIKGTARYVSWLYRAWEGHPRRLEMAIVSYSSGIGTLKKQQQMNQAFNEEQREYLERVLKTYRSVDGKG